MSALDGLQVWDRGWLSSTQTLVLPAEGEAGALLFDSAHGLHAEQTLALLRHRLGDTALRAVVNTHLHSDHCGGNAAIRQAFGAEVWIPPGEAAAVRAWDEAALSHGATGQFLPRFDTDRVLAAGEVLVAGGREWRLLRAPGHDPHALMAFDGELLVAGDALWERGFGVVFPELWGEAAFGAALQVLDEIEGLGVRLLIPGHGPVCADVAGALAQARARLKGWQADPRAHAQYAAKVLMKYHLMEQRRSSLPALLDWAEATPLIPTLWQQLQEPRAGLRPWLQGRVDDLVAKGALRVEGGEVFDG